MIHYMRLNNEPFIAIKNGTKTIELRLNDEKRQLIEIGDLIEFENRMNGEKMKVLVKNLYKYDSFLELYEHFDKISLGYREDDVANCKDMQKYYSLDEQKKYGVLGIEISLLADN